MRAEFSKATKREALRRSGGFCEASGELYGLPDGKRCNARLAVAGVNFDHLLADSNGGEPTLENCVAACLKCHRFKSDHFDTPRAAKIKRVTEKASGIRKPSRFANARGGKYKTTIGGKTVLR